MIIPIAIGYFRLRGHHDDLNPQAIPIDLFFQMTFKPSKKFYLTDFMVGFDRMPRGRRRELRKALKPGWYFPRQKKVV